MYVHHVVLGSFAQDAFCQRNSEYQSLEPPGASWLREHITKEPAINAMATLSEFPSMIQHDPRGTRLLLSWDADGNQYPQIARSPRLSIAVPTEVFMSQPAGRI
jgi:hypothetical protein